MIESLLVFLLRLDILEKYHLEEPSFQEDVDQSRTVLYDCDVEEESRAEER